MGSLGSASIQLTLDRSQFDSDLKKLQQQDAGQVTLKLDTKGFEQQIKGLRSRLQPLLIPVELDTKSFDQQIKKLSSSIDPIKVDLAPNVKDFQEKLKRLGRISPIDVEVRVDKAAVKTQFAEIGKYAALGFAQGFSGAEDAGKSAVDSLVQSVKSQLGIQSPSRVFKEIGKYAIAGLMQGLESVDESKLKGVTNKIEDYFKKSKIKINVEVDSGDFNPLKNISGAGIGEKITSAIEEGFKKSRPKPPSTFSKIFSGIGDTLLAPLKGITTGAFEGVGLQLSKQLGTGLGRGIESQLAPIIGSFDLLGEKLITSAIPKLGNTVGGKIASAILKSPPLQKLKADLAGQITSIVGESEQLIVSQAGKQQNRQRRQQQQKLSQQELGLQLQAAIANAPLRAQQAQKIKQEVLPQYQQEVKSKSSQLSSLQADRELLVAAGTETEEIRQAADEIDLQIAQASSALVEAKKAEAFLQQQISALLSETSGTVDKLKMAGANTSGVDNVEFALKESAVKANGIVTRLDGNIKIQQENIKEARVRLKAYKQEEARLKAEAIAALQSGDDAGAKNSLLESKKAGLRATSAQQEISAYKANISENLKIKQESAGEFIQERKKLLLALEAERAALADKVLQTEQEVQPKRLTLKGVAVRSKPHAATQQTKTTQLEDLVKQPAAVIAPPTPQLFQDVLAQFQQIAGINIPSSKIPQLIKGPADAKFSGKYTSFNNAVTLPASNYDDLVKGVISPDTIKTLVHELRHAMQGGFGERQLTQSANPGFELAKGTPEETQKLGSKIAASTEFFKKGALGATSADVEVVRSLEEDAYVFAERYFEQVFKSIQQGLQSGIKSGSVPTEAELLKQVQSTQKQISANLKQSFKGSARDRKVTNSELAGSTLTDIDEQIAFVSEQLKRTDLSGETRQKLGQFKGTIERQYRTYSPALRITQPGASSLGSGTKQQSAQGQGVSGFELFEISNPKTLIPPPPPGFNLPIGSPKTTLPPPPPGFNQPIGKPAVSLPPPPPGFDLPIGTQAAIARIGRNLPDVIPPLPEIMNAYLEEAERKSLPQGNSRKLLRGRNSQRRIGGNNAPTIEVLPPKPNTQNKSTTSNFDNEPFLIFPKQEPLPDVKTTDQSTTLDEATRVLGLQAKSAEHKARRVLENIFKNSNRAAKRADKALEQLEQETNQQVAGIEAGVAYDEAIASRRTRRTIKKIQRGYAGDIDAPTIETEAPRVEKDLPKLPEKSFLKGLGKEFRLTRLSALTKQAEYLGQQAQVLLTDIDAQIALGKSQEKEAAIIQKQIQQNERRLNGILDQIKRAQSGKDPKLTPGDVQRLSGKAKELTGRIDADKERLAGIQPNIKNGLELEPVAKNLRAGIAGASEASKQQNIKELEKQNALIRENLKLLGETPPSRDPFDAILGGADKFRKMIPNLFTLLKGLLAFQVSNFLQGFFTNLATDAFKAFVELDRLKTALNFASGGSAGGAQNLAFVRKTVEDLKVPLKASTEGFVQLAAAAKGSALEGKGTRELFTGISQASTVLSLSADNTQGAILALSQMISKGKVSSEELRQQLGERLPGAMGIAARSMGVTEAEFTRLLDSGQILSQDFLPKFAKQLQAEFGDAAKDAAGNAQSAIFGVENAFLSLQQGIGEGVSPAATAGLNALSILLEGVAKVGKELGFILLGVTVALSIKMVGALKAVIIQLIAAKTATGTLGSGLSSLGQTLNNSASVKWAAGIFAVLEVVNLLNSAINTELVQSFQKAADAAKRAAEETKKAFEKPKPESSNAGNRFLDKYVIEPLNSHVGTKIETFAQKEQKERELGRIQGLDPVATSGFGRFVDDLILNPLNMVPGGRGTTYGDWERDSTIRNIDEQGLVYTEALAEARYQLAQFKTGTGEAGKLRPIDAQLKAAEEQRAILQAQIKRDFIDKGQTVPADSKRQLDSLNLKVSGLNDQRAEAAKPLSLEENRITQKINLIKSQLENFNNPDTIANQGGEAATDIQRQKLKAQLEPLKQALADLQAARGALRIDPIRAFTQSLRELNLALAEGQEKNKESLAKNKLANSREAIASWSTNKLASKKLTFLNANDEYNTALADEKNYAAQDKAYNKAVNRPEFQATLKRLGLSPDSSIAKIDDILKNTSDEADKGILEKFKSGRETKVKFAESKQATADAKAKRNQVIEDTSLYLIDEEAAGSRAAMQKSENDKISFLKGAQAVRLISEEIVNEKIARIQLNSSQLQKKSIVQQLTTLRAYHDQGKISAEKFIERQRSLSVELTTTERQEAENRLAVQQAVTTRRLKDIEFVNKKAEMAIALSSTSATTVAKEKLLASGLTPSAQDQFALSQNQIDQKTVSDKIGLIKNRIAQNKQLYKEGSRDAREFALEQYSLNVELASANRELVDLKIASEEKYRETVEHNIQRIMQAEESRFKSLVSQLDYQKASLDLYNQSLERTSKLEESRYNLAKALTDATVAPLETKRDSANRALELSRRLKDDNLDFGVRGAIYSQLNEMGFGANELDILAQRSKIEDEIAAKKLESLKLEQEYQRKALTLDLQRQRIAAETAVYDAESASLAAAKSKLEAEGAMRIAQIKKDPTAIKSAEVGLEIAGREAEISDKRLENAQKNLGIQDELAKNATMAQELNQRTALEGQLAADKARKQGEGVERAEAMVLPKSSDSVIDSSGIGKRERRRPGRIGESFVENGRTIKDGVDVTNFQLNQPTLAPFKANVSRTQTTGVRGSRQRDGELEIPRSSYYSSTYTGSVSPSKIEINQLPELKRKPGENLFEAYQRHREELSLKGKSKGADMPPTDMVTSVLNKAGIQVSDSGYSKIAESLKMANQGIEQRLDKLIESMSKVANSPRSISVSSPNPFDDAAKLINDMSRGQVVGSGL